MAARQSPRKPHRRANPARPAGTAAGPRGGRPATGRSQQARSGVPGRPPHGRSSAAPTGPRRRLEVASAPALLVLHRLPRWLVPVILGVLLVVGLAVSGPWRWLGALALLIVGAFIGWLTALSWPLLSGTARLARVAVCGAVVGVAVLKALGRF